MLRGFMQLEREARCLICRKRMHLLMAFCTVSFLLLSWYQRGYLSSEGSALSIFRGHIENDPYGALSDWVGSGDPCSWFDFWCSTGRVIESNVDRTKSAAIAISSRRLLWKTDPVNWRIGRKRHPLLKFSSLSFLPMSGKLLLSPRASRALPPLMSAPLPAVPSPAPLPPPPPSRNLFTAFSASSPLSEKMIPSPSGDPPAVVVASVRHKSPLLVYIFVAIGAFFLLGAFVFILFCLRGRMTAVRPWVTGLSGQLQKAFVTGIPKLKRAELEVACEDFSNIIGTSPDSILFKGTLSSGVEIAVFFISVTSSKDWSRHLEDIFRKKIEALSMVNHKNFVNLLGYCDEENPFSRMMVFEYAPNGTLYEHLHMKEAEPLDWPTRMRIIMGIAYCLEYMHQLSPPAIHRSLTSDSIYLTDDYAAKVSDIKFHSLVSTVRTGSLVDTPVDQQSNVLSFGVVLLETLTGRPPYSNGLPLLKWVLDYMIGAQPQRFMVDPMLTSFEEEVAVALSEVARACVVADPDLRPSMPEVAAQLREITGISPIEATPRLSPLWWAELEIIAPIAS